jgi:hypothetical protein
MSFGGWSWTSSEWISSFCPQQLCCPILEFIRIGIVWIQYRLWSNC